MVRLARTVAIAVTLIVIIATLASRGGSQVSRAGSNRSGADHSRASTGAANLQIPAGGPYPLGTRTTSFTDSSRDIYLPGGKSEPRTLVVTVYYPAAAPTGGAPVDGAPPYRRNGPYPLIVFAPGFQQVPTTYAVLLEGWARAGYVVAGITFPLTNPNAPGGANEMDIANQPADMTFVIGQIEGQSASPGTPLTGMIDPKRVVVAGHSDGGDTAMAAAFNTCCRNATIAAAIILSGAELHEPGGSYFPAGSPPLLAVQGTSDPVNHPTFTEQLYSDDSTGPKYELLLQGAGPIDAYSTNDTFEKVVAAVTVDFLNGYLKGSQASLSAITRDGTVNGVASIQRAIPQPGAAATTTSSSQAPSSTTTSVPAGSGTTVPNSSSTTIFIPSAA